MRRGFVSSVSILLAGAGLTMAQPPSQPIWLSAPQPAIEAGTAPQRGQPEKLTQPSEPAKLQATPTAEYSGVPMTPYMDGARRSGPTPEDLRDNHWGPDESFWVNADYLLWWTRKGPLPLPIVTTGTNGIIGDPNTSVLIGQSPFDYADRHGGRLDVGFWLDNKHIYGFEIGGFLLSESTVSSAASSNGSTLLAQPIFTTDSTTQVTTASAVQLAFPGFQSGAVTVSSFSRLWGADAGFLRNLADCPNWRADMTFGFRYLDLTEDLNIDRTSTALNGSGAVTFIGFPVNQGDSVTANDRFWTRNQMFLGQIGGRAEWHDGRWSLGVHAKVGLGPNHETVTIQGVSTGPANTNPAAIGTFNSGILATTSTSPGISGNIGRHGTDDFVIEPEMGIQVGFNVTSNIRCHLGYDFLYISDVVRPGDQVNLKVNPNFVPISSLFSVGSLSFQPPPTPTMRQADFWAHGINAGISFSF